MLISFTKLEFILQMNRRAVHHIITTLNAPFELSLGEETVMLTTPFSSCGCTIKMVAADGQGCHVYDCYATNCRKYRHQSFQKLGCFAHDEFFDIGIPVMQKYK